MRCDFFGAPGPRIQFFFRIQIIVARLDPGVLSKPFLVVSPVNADVADVTGHSCTRLYTFFEQGLIDVHESDSALCQLNEKFRYVPRFVSDFENERKLSKCSRDIVEPLPVLVGPAKRPGKLEQQGSKFSGAMHSVHWHTRLLYFCPRPRGFSLVSETLPQLCAEAKIRKLIHAGDPLVRR